MMDCCPRLQEIRSMPQSAAFRHRLLALGFVVLSLLSGGVGAAPPAATPGPRLTEAAVRAVLDSMEEDARRLSLATLEQALAPDVEIRVRTWASGSLQDLRFDRETYLTSARAALNDLRSEGVTYSSVPGAPDIRIAPDGLTAIASRTTAEQYRGRDGRVMSSANLSTLQFVWRDGRPMIRAIAQDDQTSEATP
jgi:hypothetical protein